MALAVITGAGSGIGAATAHALAARGHSLALVGRSGAVEDTRDAIARETAGVQVYCHQVDLAVPTDRAALVRAIQRIIRDDGHQLTGVVHAAGVGTPAANLASLVTGDLEHAMAVNLTAPLEITRDLLPALTGCPGGARVLLIGAGIDERPQPGTGSYGISKMALKRLGHQLRTDLAHEGHEHDPAVGLFQPGVVDTPGLRAHIAAARDCALPHADYLAERLAQGQAYTPATVGEAITSLLLDTAAAAFEGQEWRPHD